MFRILRKFIQLGSTEKRLFLQVWRCLWQVRIRLWVCGYKSTRGWLGKKASAGHSVTADQQHAKMIARFVGIAHRFVPKATCLTQAVAGEHLLILSGFKPCLHIGVNKEHDNYFEGHAWIILNGRKLIGGPASIRFKSIYQTFPN